MKITIEFDHQWQHDEYVLRHAKMIMAPEVELVTAPVRFEMPALSPQQAKRAFTPIIGCGLSMRVQNALAHASSHIWMEDVVILTDAQLRKITHVGPSAIKEIRAWKPKA